ncbi:MAG: hypothetical protein PHV05_09575 [Candidatus Riflebacteria bacterium]|nr:hypothetical protein [Candidatus Riflebacteria bacterium]
MRVLVLLVMTVFLSSQFFPCQAADNYLQCLVIGQEADPVKGRELFKKAMESWNRGQLSEAINLYEQAIIADHSILKHEDHGLAMKLLEKYRLQENKQDVSSLCRLGFFENILVGNLESSITYYEEAAKIATSEANIQLARDEAERLQQQLAYITSWQEEILKENRSKRIRDFNEYLQLTKIKDLQNQFEDNSLELEELNERLTFLQKQEKEVMEAMYSSVRNAARYRRQHYYPGAYQSTTPDPSANTFPEGNWGSDGSTNPGQIANPYSGQPHQGISRDAALNRFYTYRGRARRQQDQLDQIRAEISGIQRRIAQTEKTMKTLQKKGSNEAAR